MFIIGIAGPSASGKSSLAHNLLKELDTNEAFVISADNYYKELDKIPFEKGKWRNFDHPDSLDHDLLASHISSLLSGNFVDMPIYVHSDYASTNKKRLGGYKLIIIEGILLFTHEQLRKMMDLRIYVDAPLDSCLIRKINRDMMTRGRTIDAILEDYENIVRPMFLKFIEPSKKHANLIVPHGGRNKIAIDTIKARFKEMLTETKSVEKRQ